MESEKKYYAFISYSRSDAKIAQDIHHKLEKYPYPKKLTDEEHKPYHEKFVRPVFLDTADLSVRREDFTEEIREALKNAKYLIVLCSPAAAKSHFVADEINYFVQTHNGDCGNIIPVIIDKVQDELPPHISDILEKRNCPIWNTGKGENAKMDNKYCFYHILEYLLGVEFNKLFSRYLHYTRRKRAIRFNMALIVLLTCTLLSFIAWQKEREVSTFEQKTFPYSLVVGYVENFLQPFMSAQEDSIVPPHILIYLPKNYEEHKHHKREYKLNKYIRINYPIKDEGIVNIKVGKRKRDLSIYRIRLEGVESPIYIDNARTVIAIKKVVDFKKGQTTLFNNVSADEMVKYYTDEFIVQTDSVLRDGIPDNPYLDNIHFIRSTQELDSVLHIITHPQ